VRIAYVITRADAVGGASIHVRDLARAMLEQGDQPVILVGGEGPVTQEFARCGLPFQSLHHLGRALGPLRDRRALGELLKHFRALKPDLVSTHTAKAGWLGRLACSRLGLPALYTPHGWSIGSRISPAHGFLFGLAERTASRWSSAIVCVCEYEQHLALQRRIAPAGKLHVIYNGVRDVAERFRAQPERNPVRLISVARLEPPKDHETLLHALARLPSLEWRLDLAGDGPREDALRALADSLGLGARVRFLGYQPDLAPLLAGAQVFVLSSRSEAFPRSILEAMRAGLPIVASDVGGVREAVTHGVNGLLAPAGDPGPLADAIRGLIEDPPRRKCLGAASRAAYQARFRFERMLDETLTLYAKVRT